MNNLTHTLEVAGMSCPGCASKVSGHLASHNIPCEIDFASAQLRVSPDDAPKASALVTALGYSVNDSRSDNHSDHSHGGGGFQVWGCIILTAPLILGHIFNLHALHNPWLQLLLSTPVYIIGALHFGRSAWIGLRSGVAHMDLLVILGATAAYIYSVAGLALNLGDNYLFFESAASIITFVLIGGLVEQLAVKQTNSALRALKRLRPVYAKRKLSDDTIEEIDISELRIADHVIAGIGDSVPCDGQVIDGSCEIDEATLTGEAIPAVKAVGSKVFAGTIVAAGSITLQADSVGAETVLGRIIDTVSSAQFSKPKIQRLGDRVSAIFVPAVIILSVATFFFNLQFGLDMSSALLRAIAVVVIACPCAMGLATPVAIMVCLGELAKRGVLIKSGDIIEGLAAVNRAFFDKTGTLTKGDIDVVLLRSTIAEQELAAIVMGLEQTSSHPIAKALVNKYSDFAPLKFDKVEERLGIGVFGFKGSSVFSIARVADIEDGDLGVFRNSELLAVFKLTDEIRAESLEAVRMLKNIGVSSLILSGDSSARCLAISRTLAIPAHGGLLPAEKLKKVQELADGQPSVFVGDGVNDVLGLAGAGIGISFSDASDIAIKTAPIVITRADLRIIPEIISYSRRVLFTIKQNLFWAFFYNIVAIPIAACGLLTPTFAAIVMGLSDVIVVGNSLRLRRRG